LEDADTVEFLCDWLRGRCDRLLPVQMVPQIFVFVGDLPLTASGKVDRMALPGPRIEIDPGPMTTTERWIASVWKMELGLKAPVGPLSRFGSVGGDSMTALLVTRRMSYQLAEDDGTRRPAEVAGAPVVYTVGETAGYAGTKFVANEYGDIPGPLSPVELLSRQQLRQYARFIERSGIGLPPDYGEPGTEEGGEECMPGVEDTSVEGVLVRAAGIGLATVVRVLLAEKVDPDAGVSHRRPRTATPAQRRLAAAGKEKGRHVSPLHVACTGDRLEVAQVLLEAKAKVTVTQQHGMTPLLVAAGVSWKCTKLLLEFKAPLTMKSNNLQTVLHCAARANRVDVLEGVLPLWLVDESCQNSARVYGTPVDWRDRWHRTPVHWGVINGHMGAVRALLEAGAAPSPPELTGGRHGKTTHLPYERPIDIARRVGAEDMVAVLLEFGAKL